MSVSTLSAWFLYKRPHGDTSARVTFFTREQGIITCLYKGARLAKNTSYLQPFYPLCLNINTSRGWYYVKNLESNTAPLLLKGTALFAGLYLNEVLYHVLKAEDPDEKLFNHYQTTLQGLAAAPDLNAIEVRLRQFEINLLTACGYALCLTHESVSQRPIDSQKTYQYIAGQGLILAVEGLAGSNILAMAEGHWQQPEVLKTAKVIMREVMNFLLEGKELKSKSLFKKTSL